MIEQFYATDVEAVVAIENECFGSGSGHPGKPWDTKQFLEEQGSKYFRICTHQNYAVGYIGAKEYYHRNEGLGIWGLGTRKHMRRSGVARELYKFLESQAEMDNYKQLYLEVWKHNDVAINFYLSLGFEITGRVTNYYGPGFDAYQMKKNLRK